MKAFVITKNEAGQRFDKYLKKLLPEASGGFLYKMLRKKNILLNDCKAEGSEKLTPGDTVTLFFSDETFERFSGRGKDSAFEDSWKKDPRYVRPEILFEDENILAMNKPAGLLSQKAAPDDFSANEQLLRYLYESGSLRDEELATFHPAVCNRLDRNTSGILLAGKTLSGLQDLSAMLHDQCLRKYYHALVYGNLTTALQKEAWLQKDPVQNRVVISEQEKAGAQHIRTDFTPLRQFPGYTLLQVRLHTGKSHQIRAQLAFLGFPIVGDPKYGSGPSDSDFCKRHDISRQMLHARELYFPDGRRVTAPYPADFSRALEAVDKIR